MLYNPTQWILRFCMSGTMGGMMMIFIILVALMLVGSIASIGPRWAGTWCAVAVVGHARYQQTLALLLFALALDLASPHYRIIQVILSMPKFPVAITWCCSWKSRHRRLRQIFIRILPLLKQTQMGRCVCLLAGLWLTGFNAFVFGLGYLGLGKCIVWILLPLNTQQLLTLGPQCLV